MASIGSIIAKVQDTFEEIKIESENQTENNKQTPK